MISLIFEIVSTLSIGAGTWYWINDMSDLKHWLFFLIFSAIMLTYANRYEK